MMKEISKSNVFEVFINEKDKKKINGGRVTRSYINKCSEIVKRLKGKINEWFKKKVKVTCCEGEGQGSCKRCVDKGIWNRMWMSFLYKIEGLEGYYCAKCVDEIMEEMKWDFLK